jgi:hypothetical protein
MLRSRRHSFAASLIAGFFIAAASLGPSVSWAQTNAEKTVLAAMTKGEDGMYGVYNSFVARSLSRLGDASSVALTRLLADKPIADADIPAILLVVRDSYDSPISIQDAAERQPRTTLYLLRSLSQGTKDPKIVASIEETTAYVRSQYAAYSRNHPAE